MISGSFFKYVWNLVRFGFILLVFYLIAERVELNKVLLAIDEVTPSSYVIALVLYFMMIVSEAAGAYFSLKLTGIKKKYFQVLKINYFSHFFSVMTVFVGIASRWHGFSGVGKKYNHAFVAILADRLISLTAHHFVFVIFYFQCKQYFLHEGERFTLLLYALLGSVALILLNGALLNKSISNCIKNILKKNSINSKGRIMKQVNKIMCDLVSIWNSFKENYKYYFFTVFAWIVYIFFGVILLKYLAAKIGIHITLSYVVWIYCSINLSQLIPVTIFGIGLRDGILIIFLARIGVSESSALALSILILSLLFIHVLIGGIWFLLDPKVKESSAVS